MERPQNFNTKPGTEVPTRKVLASPQNRFSGLRSITNLNLVRVRVVEWPVPSVLLYSYDTTGNRQVTGAKGHFPPRVLKSEGTCNTTWSSEGDGCGVTNGCANCDNDKLGSWCMINMDDWCYCAVKKPEAAAKSGTTALTTMALTACWRFVITSQTVGALL